MDSEFVASNGLRSREVRPEGQAPCLPQKKPKGTLSSETREQSAERSSKQRAAWSRQNERIHLSAFSSIVHAARTLRGRCEFASQIPQDRSNSGSTVEAKIAPLSPLFVSPFALIFFAEQKAKSFSFSVCSRSKKKCDSRV